MNEPEWVKTREFRRKLARMVNGTSERPVGVLNHGERKAVLLSAEEYERMRQVYTSVRDKLRTA